MELSSSSIAKSISSFVYASLKRVAIGCNSSGIESISVYAVLSDILEALSLLNFSSKTALVSVYKKHCQLHGSPPKIIIIKFVDEPD